MKTNKKILFILFIISTISFSIVYSQFSSIFIIQNTGKIQTATIIAASGYWQDIQNAVDIAEVGDTVYIPEGEWDFINVGESWGVDTYIVEIPAGINLMGATTEKDSDGQVIGGWKTILKIPWDAPGQNTWFRITGTRQPDEPTRISDIELRGYRYYDNESVTIPKGIRIDNVLGFRVDHSNFQDMAWGGVSVWNSNGVIDHSRFVNSAGYVTALIADCTVIYGVEVYRAYGNYWDNDITNVLGKNTDYTVFIEDNYFEKWRHNVASNTGAHYVFRYNTIQDDYGFGSVDAHGWFQAHCSNPQHGLQANVPVEWSAELNSWVCAYPVPSNPGGICGIPYDPDASGGTFYTQQVGTRAVEIYGNTINNSIQSDWATMIRGGAGVAFNNTVGGGMYSIFIYLSNDMFDKPHGSKVWINDWYIWNNTMIDGCAEVAVYDLHDQIIQDINYFLRSPNLIEDGWEYTPYTYPHPLTK